MSSITSAADPTQRAGFGRQMLNKVPEVTLYFWLIKVLCTTIGETFSDNLVTKWAPGGDSASPHQLQIALWKVTGVTTLVLVVLLAIQFTRKKYLAPVYWANIVVISLVGTQITDLFEGQGDQPNNMWAITIVSLTMLAAVFAVWYFSERTLSMHSIVTSRREAFYWLAILTTFATGTAVGDLLAEKLSMGYLTTLLLFVGVIAFIVLLWKVTNINGVLAFWLAYIMTRPLGASTGDFLSSKGGGGLGLGTIGDELHLPRRDRDPRRLPDDSPSPTRPRPSSSRPTRPCIRPITTITTSVAGWPPRRPEVAGLMLRATAASITLGTALAVAGCGASGPSRTPRPEQPRATPSRQAAPRVHAKALRVRTSGPLPAPVQLPAVAAPLGHIVLAGGLDSADASVSDIVVAAPGRPHPVGRLPSPLHDGAATAIGSRVYFFGGGNAGAASPEILRIYPGPPRAVGQLPVGLSDVAAATSATPPTWSGGYTGARPVAVDPGLHARARACGSWPRCRGHCATPRSPRSAGGVLDRRRHLGHAARPTRSSASTPPPAGSGASAALPAP